MKLKLFAIAGLAGLLASACASQPEPVAPTAPPPAPPPAAGPSAPPQPAGPTPGTERHFQVTAGDRVFFDLDRADLTAEARETLRRQAAWLSQYPGARVLVAGNCDERGTREYNLALGARRANAARDFLISQGVDPARISTVSYGKERPSGTQSTERCWALNRNATTTIVSGALAS